MGRSVVHIVESMARPAGSVAWLLPGLFDFQQRKGWQVDVISDQNMADAHAAVVRADVVHVHGVRGETIRHGARLLRTLPKQYFVSTYAQVMPGLHRRRPWAERWAAWTWQRGLLRRAWCVHALSEAESAYLKRKRLTARVKVLPPGVGKGAACVKPDLVAEASRDGARMLLYLGPLHPSGGLVPFLKAAAGVADQFPDLRLVLAGQADPLWSNVLQAAIRRQGFEDRVTFMSSPTVEQVEQLLRETVLLVQPSPGPCCPVSALQAMAGERPVLVSPGCHVPEVETAGAGWIVEPKRTAWQQALSKAFSGSPTELQEMGRRAAQVVQERYDWDRLGHEYLNLYARLLAYGGSTPRA